MAKNKFCLGMLVIVLVFGMTVAGCDNNTTSGSGGDNGLGNYWSTAPISPEALAISGLTQAQFNQINTAAGGGFRGWLIIDCDCDYCVYFPPSQVILLWAGRSVANFTSVANAIAALPGFTQDTRKVLDGGIHEAEGFADGIGSFGFVEYEIRFFSRRFEENGYYIPVGTLKASFGDL